MRKRKYLLTLAVVAIMSGTLIACGTSKDQEEKETAAYVTPEDMEPVYYGSEEELPADMYYIVHTETVIETQRDGTEAEIEVAKYYPVYNAVEKNFSETYDVRAGFNSNRIMWVNYNVDEGLIPTMYPGDKMIYKSATYIPTKYSLEKFFDNGYTLGICGLTQDLSSNYRYYSAAQNSGHGYVMATSDAVGFEGLEAESIYLVAVGDERVSPANVSLSGTISGLTLMEKYPCDIRTGTEQILADLTCNVHYFSSAENYMFGSFTFITEHIAEINIPDYVTTGYYNMNGAGMFRYLKDGTDYKGLQASDYNETIYTYNDEGHVDGTTIGMVFDENSFLIPSELIDNYDAGDGTGNTYEQYIESKTGSITDRTLLTADESGHYSGNYEFLIVSEPVISDKDNIYEIKAMNTENMEIIRLKYTQKSGKDAPQENNIYSVIFTEPENNYDGYIVSTFTELSEPDAATEETVTETPETESMGTEISETETLETADAETAVDAAP